MEDAVYPVGPGSVFIVRSWEQHRIEIEPNTPYERMVFWFKKEQIEKLDPQHVLLAPFFDRQPGRDNAYGRRLVERVVHDYPPPAKRGVTGGIVRVCHRTNHVPVVRAVYGFCFQKR